MPIESQCQGCSRRLRVSDEHAGKKARCPHCGTVYTVPGGGSESATPAPQPSSQWFLQTEDGQVYGPVPKNEMDQWAQQGRVTAGSKLRPESSSEWQVASQVYPQLAAGDPFGKGAPSPHASNNPYAAPSGGVAMGTTPHGMEAHRGGLVLTLGILGIFCCQFLSIAAWVIGQADIKAMDQGRMDPAGRGTTQAGMIMGIIGCVLMGIGIVLQVAIAFFEIVA